MNRNSWFQMDPQTKQVTRCPEGVVPNLADDREVEQTYLLSGLWVSTVFLGLDHSFSTHQPKAPIVFETMVFDLQDREHPFSELYCDRYSTYAEALRGHRRTVARWATGRRS